MNNKIFIIRGTQGSGKTTFLKNLVEKLSTSGLRIGGFLAEGYWKDNLRDRFELVDTKSGDRLVYCQRDQKVGWEQIRHFYINPKAVLFGEKALEPLNLADIDLVVIDEIGPFELAGKGWSKSFVRILHKSELPIIISVRESLVDQVVEYWKLNVEAIFEVSKNQTENATKEILNKLKSS